MNLLEHYFPKSFFEEKKQISVTTELPNNEILLYSKNLIYRNTQDLNIEFLWTADDCLSMCYAYQAKNKRQAIKIVKSFILNEVTKFKNEHNSAELFDINQLDKLKICKSCKEEKSINDFYAYTDSKTGQLFRLNDCHDCKKKKKQISNARPIAKIKARLRYEKFKNKKKLKTI